MLKQIYFSELIVLTIILVSISLGLLGVVATAKDLTNKVELAHDGKRGMAKIVSREQTFHPVRSGGFNSYEVVYNFHGVNKSGESFEQVHRYFDVTQAQYREMENKTNIEIVYLEDNPSINAPVDILRSVNPNVDILARVSAGVLTTALIVELMKRFKLMPFKYGSTQGATAFIGKLGILAAGFIGGSFLGMLFVKLLELAVLR